MDEGKVNLNISIREVTAKMNIKIVEFSGGINLDSSQYLIDTLNPLIESDNLIVLDLKKLDTINSAGLTIFYRIYTMTDFIGFILDNENDLLLTILKFSGLYELAKIYSSQEEAIGALSQMEEAK